MSNCPKLSYPRYNRSISSYVGGSVAKDRSFKISPDALRDKVNEFMSGGGKVKVIKQEDITSMPMPVMKGRGGWKGATHGEKASGIQGKVEE